MCLQIKSWISDGCYVCYNDWWYTCADAKSKFFPVVQRLTHVLILKNGFNGGQTWKDTPDLLYPYATLAKLVIVAFGGVYM